MTRTPIFASNLPARVGFGATSRGISHCAARLTSANDAALTAGSAANTGHGIDNASVSSRRSRTPYPSYIPI